MAYEDKFRSVREHGPRPGTEATIVDGKTAEEHFSHPKRKYEQEEPREQIELALEVPELSLDELRAMRETGEQPQAATPERPVDSILNDLEKMIVDEDGIFEDLEDEEYVTMIITLIREARNSYAQSVRRSLDD
jgi:hypothetical protein